MRAERLLPLAIVASALTLAASELTTVFELVSPTGQPLESISGADRHNYAMAILALFAISSLVAALVWASRPAAIACAAAGAIALLVFLIGDLPDAGRVGTLDDPQQPFVDARAEPQAGFWLLLVGSVGLAASGAALASLAREQLESLGSRYRRDPREADDPLEDA